MGLKLLKNRDGSYRRTWYALLNTNGQKTTVGLKTPLRGRIPLTSDGRFSLSLAGDDTFEQSKADAKAELKGEIERRKSEKAKAKYEAERLGVKMVRLSDLAHKNAMRKKYEIVAGARNQKYNKSVFDIIQHFAKWVAERPRKCTKKSCRFLTDVDVELVREYYAEISSKFSWQTFRKYVFILKSIFTHFAGSATYNPFLTVYGDYKGKKSDFGDKAEIAHKPPTLEQVYRVIEYTKKLTNKPYLHRLAIIASCSGLRIGDCCNLTWDKVDLAHGEISRVKTKKTGVTVAIPIFDYRPDSIDYNPVLGELRRELEAALTEREEGEKYVCPEAARIYANNPSRITEEGKTIFAHALTDGKPEPDDAVLIGEEKPHKTPVEILGEIEAAGWADGKRDRVRRVYELYSMGKTYKQIAAKIGKHKAAVSADLAAVEELTGENIRPGETPIGCHSHSHSTKLMSATRIERKQGQRAACLYGWHSCRMFFVGYAFYEIGMKEAELIGITGHATVKMVRHYIETSGRASVAAAKRRNAERFHNPKNKETVDLLSPELPQNAVERTKTPLPAIPAQTANNGAVVIAKAIQAVLSNPTLSDETKNAAILALSSSAIK